MRSIHVHCACGIISNATRNTAHIQKGIYWTDAHKAPCTCAVRKLWGSDECMPGRTGSFPSPWELCMGDGCTDDGAFWTTGTWKLKNERSECFHQKLILSKVQYNLKQQQQKTQCIRGTQAPFLSVNAAVRFPPIGSRKIGIVWDFTDCLGFFFFSFWSKHFPYT